MHSYDAAVLHTAGGPALGAGAVACAVCGVLLGVPGVLGAVVATLVTAAVFTVTLWLCSVTRSLRPSAVTVTALSGYVLVALALGGLLVATAGVDGLSPDAVAAGLVVGALAWTAGEVRAFGRLRTAYVEPDGWPVAAGRRPEAGA